MEYEENDDVHKDEVEEDKGSEAGRLGPGKRKHTYKLSDEQAELTSVWKLTTTPSGTKQYTEAFGKRGRLFRARYKKQEDPSLPYRSESKATQELPSEHNRDKSDYETTFPHHKETSFQDGSDSVQDLSEHDLDILCALLRDRFLHWQPLWWKTSTPKHVRTEATVALDYLLFEDTLEVKDTVPAPAPPPPPPPPPPQANHILAYFEP